MKAFTGVTAVLLTSAVGSIAIALPGQGSWRVWAIVACATALPAISSMAAIRKGRRIGGREGMAWHLMAGAMAAMTPVYLAEFAGAVALQTALVIVTYVLGGSAIFTVPLPNAGRHQRLVASLDAVGIGTVAATCAFWLVSSSQLDFADNFVWVITDAAIIAMVGYITVRRSQQGRIDWPLYWLISAVAAYLSGIVMTTVSGTPYFLGANVDYAYIVGMTSFALAPAVRDRRAEPSQQILKPVRWGHVLAPYLLVAMLAAALLAHQLFSWGHDPTGTVLELGTLATVLLVLGRQLAMIAEQRHKIELEQSGVIATVSHELRTPLTTVMGFLDLLEDWGDFSEDEKVEMVTMMRGQSHVMARVVGDLISVARQEMEQLDIATANLPVDELLTSGIGRVPELEQTTVRCNVDKGAALTADGDRMLQIMTNYLSNAAKYGSGQVEIAVFEESGETVIEVHDNGPGVPDIFHLVIWERFERGPQRQGAIPGSGIGLAVARGIARSHGGETHYRRSERLGGACFSVRIPLHRPLLQKPVPLAPAGIA